MLHGRVVRPPAVGATLVERRRELGPRPARRREGRRQEELRRRRRREAVAGDAGGGQAEGDVDAGRGLPSQRDFYDYLRKQKPTRDTLRRQLEGRRREAGEGRDGRQGDVSASVSDARIDRARRARSPTCRAARRRSGRRRSRRTRRAAASAMLLGLPAENVRVDLHARRPAATASTAPTRCRTTRRCCRRRSASRCACSSRARTRWRGRTTASPFVIDQRVGLDADGTHRRVGLRGVVADARRPARLRHARATSSPACWPVSSRRRSRRERRAPDPAAVSTTAATPRRRMSPAASAAQRRHRDGRERARADAHRARRRSSPVRCDRRRGCRTRSRTNRSWTRSRRTVKADPVAYRLRHLSDPRLNDVVKAAAKAANWETRPSPRPDDSPKPASPAAAASSCVLYEGDNGYCAMVAEVDVDQETGQGRREAPRRRAGLRPDLESRRHAEPARRRRAAGHEPRARRRSDVGRSEGDVDRLADLSQPVARRRRADDRERADQPARRRGDRRRRDGDHRSSPPPSATRSSTPPARGSARCRSRRSASRRRSRTVASVRLRPSGFDATSHKLSMRNAQYRSSGGGHS